MLGLFRRKTAPIDVRALIDDNMDYTITPATRSNVADYDKIKTIVETLKMDVVLDKAVAGINYQYYLKPSKLTDYSKLIKNINLFQVMFGPTVRMGIENEYVLLEVPGAKNNTVYSADILRNNEYYNSKGLTVAIGKMMDYTNILADISKMPHMLVAGTTGSGKSVFMHQLIVSLLMNHTPEELQLYLVDPKMVEFPVYQPLRNCKVVSSTVGAVDLLNNLCNEMDRRYAILARGSNRDIDSYNATANKPMSRIVVFIDELADLILTSKKAVENSIVRLAQKARACGIHLVVATQRPDRTVVTGLIKTNIPVKACLKVNSRIDSRIVLDRAGGETLTGKGDMLYLGEGMVEPVHCHSGYVSEKEIKNIVFALSMR